MKRARIASALFSLVAAAPFAHGAREELSLGGQWTIRADSQDQGTRDGWSAETLADESKWRPILVPSHFEIALGESFDGVAWYRRQVRLPEAWRGSTLLVQFDGVATDARVFWNGSEVGSHLGAWTPFQTDVTRHARFDRPNLLAVRVDEKVGHNTQGFLPIIAPHFGGVWQGVRIVAASAASIDDARILLHADLDEKRLDVEVPIYGAGAARLQVQVVRDGRALASADLDLPSGGSQCVARGRVPVSAVAPWTPASPHLYSVVLRLVDAGGREIDHVERRVGFRTIRAEGTRLLLNGQPLSVRGVLNWGYYPPSLSPAPSDETIRREIRDVRAMGFNLIKFCLWVPPRRYHEIADEMGMLTWQEYPTWHPQFDQAHRDDLFREFTEFFDYDRNHPSVILRSLTCETGPGADLQVVRALYDRAHERIPGSVVEDDSSWISWNRVSDFYDDHPYGNNDTWVSTLEGLNNYVSQHDRKPLLLGEAITGDTWIDLPSLEKRIGEAKPWWLPHCFEAQKKLEAQVTRDYGRESTAWLVADSLRYVMAGRKYQIETFRRVVPDGGYVVSVIRDFTLARMGLYDHDDRLKWPPEAWSWQGDLMLLLSTPKDRRSFASGERIRCEILASNFTGEALSEAPFSLRFFDRPPVSSNALNIQAGRVARLYATENPGPVVDRPTPAQLVATLASARNAWILWIVPKPAPPDGTVRYGPGLEDVLRTTPALAEGESIPASASVVVAHALDARVFDYLDGGGHVLLLANEAKRSFRVQPEPFYRGSLWLPPHPVFDGVPRDLLLDLQTMDLHGSGVMPVRSILDQVDPIAFFLDTHDLADVIPYGLVFETGVGKGRLLVSALRHAGETNAAGAWLVGALARDLAQGPPPKHSLPEELRTRIAAYAHAEMLDLALGWRFAADPTDGGVVVGWPASEFDDSKWKPMRAGNWWEFQGGGEFDGVAWYRRLLTIPEGWSGKPIRLVFEGVDDAYDLYVDGTKVGSGGDVAKRESVWDRATSHDLTRALAPGKPHVIAVRVTDWGGGGGLNRSVYVTTSTGTAGVDFMN